MHLIITAVGYRIPVYQRKDLLLFKQFIKHFPV